jgi:hypothetical protein
LTGVRAALSSLQWKGRPSSVLGYFSVDPMAPASVSFYVTQFGSMNDARKRVRLDP